jgi:ABC-type amino acid transport substrate-binding protein
METLAGQKVGVVKNTIYQNIIEKTYPSIELVAFSDMDKGLRKVQDGEIIGFVDNLI